MTRIKIKFLIWDNWNVEHIKKHNVTAEEAIEAGKNLIYHRRTYGGRFLAIGRSGKRLLALVVSREGTNKYYLVTARDVNKAERKKANEKQNL